MKSIWLNTERRVLTAFSETILAPIHACKARVARAVRGRVRGLLLRPRRSASARAGRAALRRSRARDVCARRLGDADARRARLVREACARLLDDDGGVPTLRGDGVRGPNRLGAR